jgi:signal transduction histidine kinase
VTAESAESSGFQVQVRIAGKDRAVIVPQERLDQARHLWRLILREPFQKHTWTELFFFVISAALAVTSLAFVGSLVFAGIVLAITFIGVVIIGCAVRGAHGLGTMYRSLARNLIDEHITEPDPFVSRRGLLGWLQAALRDRAGWRAIAYFFAKTGLSVFGVWFALSVWIDAFFCLAYPMFGGGAVRPREFGIVRNLLPPGFFSVEFNGFFHDFFIFFTGVLLLFLAPWTMRLVTMADKILMRAFLAPDALTVRVRSLEQSRAQTVDASAATLRRIERDLHDGTQAQLVALAMRLGQAKEKLSQGEDADLGFVRQLVDEAHKGAKEAIAELRDLARGIHPPALDVGLEGALSTLAARSSVPSDLVVVLNDRPTPAIETIAYFCVAELLANVAQHAQASRAHISCMQYGGWLRIVVRDDGIGGARLATKGSTSSGLAGLTDRVHAVDGRLDVKSPEGGPTVVTVDLPLHA